MLFYLLDLFGGICLFELNLGHGLVHFPPKSRGLNKSALLFFIPMIHHPVAFGHLEKT